MLGLRSKYLVILIPFLICILVVSSVVCILVIHFSRHNTTHYCNPSSCGSIRNISSPFRLNTDPENCGNPDYQLTCDEQNRTVLTLNSQKYYVQSINYDNYTVRVVDPGVQQNNICSFPRYALAQYSFPIYYDSYPYDIAKPLKMTPYDLQHPTLITVPIFFLRCPFPMKSSAFVETTKECWNKSSDSSGGYAYAKLGSLPASDLRISCRVELITMTSWRIQENVSSQKVSLLEIHDAMMYGFELSWFSAICQQHCGNRPCYLDLKNEINCDYYYFQSHGMLQSIWFYEDVAMVAAIISAPKIIIGVPCAVVFLIIKFRRRHLSVFDTIENFLSADNNLLPIRYSYKHIKNMTKAFKEKLGEGGFGSVYKGKLRSGRDVAVKIISKSSSNGQDFINEMLSFRSKYFLIPFLISLLIISAGVICILVIHFSSHSNTTHYCKPSSCGSIHNITFPFRLNTDPKHCGNSGYELACDEQNRTVLTLHYSQKYYVQSINYDNYTIRVVDPDVQETNNVCSFPRYAVSQYSFFGFGGGYPYSISRAKRSQHYWERLPPIPLITVPIIFLSCPFPMKSSTFVETTKECWNNKSRSGRNNNAPFYPSAGHAYVKFGTINASDLRISCRVEVITMTSWRIQENNVSSQINNISVLEIHDALTYGFELSWFPALCDQNCRYGQECELDDTTNEITCWYGILQDILFYLEIVLQLVAIISAPKIIIGVPCAVVFLIIKFRRRHLSVFDAIENFLSTENNLLPIRYSYKHIKNMTKAFKEKLGEGGFGSVYKGKLRSGRHVAVKIISKPKSDGQDFINEVASMGRIHHVNIVRLVGYCAHNSMRALVYDFMSNGSLDKYINQGADASLLNWQRKFEIAVGVARGIDYLHRGCDIQILHFDIKPHNILLDENFIPKISDFGLAKLFPTDKNIVTLTAARGTIGYVAPELINRSIGAISHKADVYSFGMLLMEILGLKKISVTGQDESSQYFPSWIYSDINKGKAIEMGELDEDEKRITKKMTIVGLWCIQTSPIPRPSMSRVVEMLEGDVELLQMPTDTSFLSEPIMEMDQEQSSMPESSESIAFLPDSNSIGIIVD